MIKERKKEREFSGDLARGYGGQFQTHYQGNK